MKSPSGGSLRITTSHETQGRIMLRSPPSVVKSAFTKPPLRLFTSESTLTTTVAKSSEASSVRLSARDRQLGLTEWQATAIAGIDLLSSVLYTIGLCTCYAGRWSCVSLTIVSCGILYPFRIIYGEMGEAMPYNGGSFNCLLQLAKESSDDELSVGGAESVF